MAERSNDHLLTGITGLDAYGVATLDAFGTVISWNAGAVNLSGTAAGEAVGKPFQAVMAVDGDDLSPDYLLSVAAAGGERGVWLRRADRSRFWGKVAAAPAYDADGSVAGVVVVFRDATALKAARDELQRSRTMFEGILAIASDGVISIDESQRIIFFNEGAERIFQYSQREALGQPLEMLIPERHRAGHEERVREFGRSGVTARQMGERGAIAGRRKDGQIFPAEASISQLNIGGTRIYTAVLRDVTDRRAAEEALSQQAEELARSNADLEQFAYVASHDLQEPLRMVASYTQLLARRYQGRLDEDADEFIRYAVEGVGRMQSLINDLLAYSRVGRKGTQEAPVDMDKILRKVLTVLGPTIEDAGADVTHDELPTVAGDATQLSQLLQNLIQNAVKFSRPGVRPKIHVGVSETPGYWRFSVSDNGIGIAPEFQERIFVIFQRLHNRDEYAGTGIGLSICKKIVERHHGRIWIESDVGRGSTFYFTLPKESQAE